MGWHTHFGSWRPLPQEDPGSATAVLWKIDSSVSEMVQFLCQSISLKISRCKVITFKSMEE